MYVVLKKECLGITLSAVLTRLSVLILHVRNTSTTFLQDITEVNARLFIGTRLSLSVKNGEGARTAPSYSDQATSPTMEESRFDSRQEKIYLLSNASRPDVGPTQ